MVAFAFRRDILTAVQRRDWKTKWGGLLAGKGRAGGWDLRVQIFSKDELSSLFHPVSSALVLFYLKYD